jgi:hypothetical protein
MWQACKTKKERQQKIKDLLAVNDLAVERAVVAIYARQTEAERQSESTTESNGRGFTAYDAEILSSFAYRLTRAGLHLTPKQMHIARTRMMSYSRQLAEIAEETEARLAHRKSFEAVEA